MGDTAPDSRGPEEGAPQPAARVAQARRRPPALFATFADRMANTGLELVVLMFLFGMALGSMGTSLPWDIARVLMGALFVLYFAGFWASRHRATPFQMAGRIKVVDYAGQPLTLARALVRSVILFILVFGALSLAATARSPVMWWVAGPAIALLFVGAITRHRQCAHDFLVRSVVVRARALNAPGGPQRLAAVMAGTGSEPVPAAWRRGAGFVRDALVLLVPVALVHITATTQFDRNLYARVSYALQHTAELKNAVIAFHVEHDRLPSGPDELGTGAQRTPYPDGGYHFLDEQGRIVIRFTVLPELTRGSLVLTPEVTQGHVEWRCRHEGDIRRKYLPHACRS